MSSIRQSLRRHWLTLGFGLGFITDLALLNRVDDVFDNLILLSYVTLASVSLLLLYVGVAGRVPEKPASFLRRYIPLLMQYSFGGLLSGMLIFYGRSGDWLSNAPFLLMIVAVIFGNEFVRKKSDRLVYHLVLYFIGLYSYAVFILPVLTGKVGDLMFVASGCLALSLVLIMIKILYKIVPKFVLLNTRSLIIAISGVFIGFNLLYFTALIPPIPLSLTELSVVQFVEKFPAEEKYRIIYEDQPWQRTLPFAQPIIHPTKGAVYCFARVYMPKKLSTDIYHRWEYKTPDGKWKQSFIIDYPTRGTNEKGYRGYSYSSGYFAGIWRCSVETKRGQVLGRVVFEIDTKGRPGQLTTVVE